MRLDQFLYLASVIVFTFGALAFAVLTGLYWRERRMRRSAGSGRVFPVFTLVCGAAFLSNLLLQCVAALDAAAGWGIALSVAAHLTAGLLPPLLFHVVLADERMYLSLAGLWRPVPAIFYFAGMATAIWQSLDEQEWISTDWSIALSRLPATLFIAAGILGLIVQSASRRALKPQERRHRLWTRLLLALSVVCAAGSLAGAGGYLDLVPDYLILAFFCVTLYYRERLVFFDILVKRGVCFAMALLGLSAFFLLERRLDERLRLAWGTPWVIALMLTPFFLAAPWIYERVGRTIDRRWLKRRYAPSDAERRFTHAIQASSNEEDLRERAESSLEDIFQTGVDVEFGDTAEPSGVGLAAAMEQQGKPLGWIRLWERADSIPFLSDDRRLLQSAARTLSVVLENVRFRQEQLRQREREEHLSHLAARSELRALRAQINPHFLFNALNAIAGLIPVQPQLAEETVEQLAEVFRYALRKSEKEWVRLDEEVEFVMSCLRVEQARFGERLTVRVNVGASLGAIPVPAMSIQPLVENAVKHGTSLAEDHGRLELDAAVVDGNLRVEVVDNGPGFPRGFSLGNENGGHGLRNISDRLRGYYGNTAELKWERRGGNTHVTLLIPCPASPELLERPVEK
jgi:anti-sigma regulatory factor (Ser/Thr protein kinase)